MALTDNILAYWKLDETTGDASDSTSGGFTLTNSNVTYAAALINNGGIFNGTTARFQRTPSTDFTLTGNFSWSLWINATNLPTVGNLMSLVNKYDGAGNLGGYDLRIYNNAGTLQLGFIQATGTNVGTDFNYTFSASTWYHIVTTFDGTSKKVYINNVLQQTENYSTQTANTKLLNVGDFGWYTPTPGELGRYFDGKIDEIGVWTRMLTAAEVSSLYNNGLGFQYPFVKSSSNLITLNVG